MEGSSNVHSQKRQRTENETRMGKLLDLDVLDCPVCFEPLTIPTFQCDDGHLVCRFCIVKVSNKCPGPACNLPIGNNQCSAIERILNSVFVLCRNADLGCKERFSYGQVSSHEKEECNFSLCSCPKLECKYTGSYNSIYDHFIGSHINNMSMKFIFCFVLGDFAIDAKINIDDKNLVIWEPMEKLFFVVQCFRERLGVYVTVRSISQSTTPELRKFSYSLSYSVDGHTLTYESPEVKKLLDVSSHSPEESFMFVPNSLFRGEMFEMKVGIKKLNQE
ncbi:E3 ubiquitin-protein ligase SINA-like 11 [Cardamine amara subsp. amara]|uniref:RING-type E3 ubiquitin transferase n=1 Tax=Cardamine amara subsp. amara TaxID=228776 RepID=A0ABD1AAT2_CARAN